MSAKKVQELVLQLSTPRSHKVRGRAQGPLSPLSARATHSLYLLHRPAVGSQDRNGEDGKAAGYLEFLKMR